MPPPIYYLSASRTSNTLNYRITPDIVLALLGYGSRDRSDSQIASDLLDGITFTPVATDSSLWQSTHKEEAQNAHATFRPQAIRLATGTCVNGARPWLSYTPDDFTWYEDGGVGQTLYSAPYSQQLPRFPSNIQDIRIACMFGITEWSRPQLDLVVWTPGGSSLKVYTAETVLVNDGETKLRELWEGLLLPRIESFYRETLKPLIEVRGYETGSMYQPSVNEFVPITNALIKAEELVVAFV